MLHVCVNASMDVCMDGGKVGGMGLGGWEDVGVTVREGEGEGEGRQSDSKSVTAKVRQ